MCVRLRVCLGTRLGEHVVVSGDDCTGAMLLVLRLAEQYLQLGVLVHGGSGSGSGSGSAFYSSV